MSFTRRWMPVSAALVGAALLTACASTKSSSDSGTTTTSAGTSASSGSGSSSSGSNSAGSGSASPPSSSGSTPSSSASAYFPVKLGNTWLYRTNYGNASLGVVMETQRITSVQPVPDGQRVTITRSFHYVNGRVGDFRSTAIYVYHRDGSLTVPYQSGLTNQGTTVVVKSGSIVWPSPSQLSTGTPRTGTVQLAIQTGGRTVDASLSFTVQGVGTAMVTVPAGSYRARVLNETLQETVSSVATPLGIHSQIWTTTGVGLVKSTTNASALTGGSTISTVLMKFTAG
jgi:hypothetical protein